MSRRTRPLADVFDVERFLTDLDDYATRNRIESIRGIAAEADVDGSSLCKTFVDRSLGLPMAVRLAKWADLSLDAYVR